MSETLLSDWFSPLFIYVFVDVCRSLYPLPLVIRLDGVLGFTGQSVLSLCLLSKCLFFRRCL